MLYSFARLRYFNDEFSEFAAERLKRDFPIDIVKASRNFWSFAMLGVRDEELLQKFDAAFASGGGQLLKHSFPESSVCNTSISVEVKKRRFPNGIFCDIAQPYRFYASR